MPFVIFRRFLRKYGSGSKIRTICLYTERTGILRKKKDGCRSDLVLEDGESSLFIGIPFPNCVFLGKVKERSGVMGEILNEPSIEVSEAKERLHLLLIRRNGPFGNAGNFDGISRRWTDISINRESGKTRYGLTS